jgi:mannose-6-phosphate isomerase-like protein (cupin superfamily)
VLQRINIADKLSLFDDYFNPRIVGDLGEYYIKLVKFQGEFVWHSHEVEDEMFLVAAGEFTMKLRDGDVTIRQGEFLVVPHGVEHIPVAENEVHILLIEPKTTLNSGDAISDLTISKLDWI